MSHILIEARTLAIGGGPAVYTENLLKALVQIPSPHKFSVLVPSRGLAHFLYETNFEIIEAGWRWRLWQPLWDEFVVGTAAKKCGADLVHMTKNAAPPSWGGASMTTLHDICPLVYPELSAPIENCYWSRQMRRVNKRTDMIITVSEAEKERIIEVLGIPAEKIIVTHLGVDPSFAAEFAPEAAAEVRRRYQLPERYLLNVGTISRKKNIENLVKAYQRVKENDPETMPLVIAGRSGPGMPSSWPDGVIRLPYIHHRELPVLYRDATAFLFPSRFESFGLPVLEAMASGVPVITSDKWSMPEIAGGAAILVDPDDVAGLAGALERLLKEPQLRDELRSKGKKRAGDFSWERCARNTMEIYDKILAAKP